MGNTEEPPQASPTMRKDTRSNPPPPTSPECYQLDQLTELLQRQRKPRRPSSSYQTSIPQPQVIASNLALLLEANVILLHEAAEHRLILLLSRNTSKLLVVGDDDQSICGWRGADPSIIRTFQSDFSEGKVLILEESNRCTEHILKGAVNIVSKGTGYIAKSLGSAQGEGERIRILNSSSETRSLLDF